MEDAIGLEIGGVPVRLESDRWAGDRLSARLSRFRPKEPTASPFRVRVRIVPDGTDQAKSKIYRGFTFQGNERVVFEQPGLKGHIDLAQREAWVQFASRNCEEQLDYFLRVLYSLLLFESGGLLVHGAGVVRGGMAYVFLGPSGSGKTTVSILSGKELVLNDDLMILRPGPESCMAWSTPFSGRGQIQPNPGSAPLRALFRLVQAENHAVEPVPRTLALALLLAACPVVTADPKRGQALIRRLQSLLDRYPLYSLHFRKEPSFWEVLDQVFKK